MIRVVRLRFLRMDSRVGWLVCVRRLLPLIPPPRGWCWGWLDCLVGCYWLVTGCSFYDTSWLLWLLYTISKLYVRVISIPKMATADHQCLFLVALDKLIKLLNCCLAHLALSVH